MLYPNYVGKSFCGGFYSRCGRMCSWEVKQEGDHVTARICGDDRFEGKAYTFPKRIDALEALADMIFEEVA